jgi:ATP-dependent HslUV protease ATP-binding subunit HslU
MLPELQGRLPIRVELKALTEEDFVRILSDTRANLVEQYKALIGTEKVTLEVHPDAIREGRQDRRAGQRERREHRRPPAADGDGEVARGDQLRGRGSQGETVLVDAAYVRERLAGLAQDADLSKYVL